MVIIDNDRVVRIDQPGRIWIVARNGPVRICVPGSDGVITIHKFPWVTENTAEGRIHVNGSASIYLIGVDLSIIPLNPQIPLDSGDSSPDDNTQG